MGHIVSPISYRLYNIRYWNNNWFIANPLNYSYILNQDILLRLFFKKVFSFYFNITSAGVIFVNLKIIRSFNDLSLYMYIHDGFLDLLFFNLKKNRKFVVMRKLLVRKFYRKYRKIVRKKKRLKSIKFIRFLRKKLVLKYGRKLFFLFIKNKFLRFYWLNFKSLLLTYVKRFSPNSVNRIYVFGLSKMNVNANIISEFFFIRLTQYYTIWEVLKNINFLFRILMRKKRMVKGYKITCSGRFSRKQRTTYTWKSFGSLAFSTIKSRLDYSYRTIALKYSSCTIKVWIRLGKRKKNFVDFVI